MSLALLYSGHILCGDVIRFIFCVWLSIDRLTDLNQPDLKSCFRCIVKTRASNPNQQLLMDICCRLQASAKLRCDSLRYIFLFFVSRLRRWNTQILQSTTCERKDWIWIYFYNYNYITGRKYSAVFATNDLIHFINREIYMNKWISLTFLNKY